MSEHVLKCWPQYFDAVERGEKNFEVRRDDRGFQKGDTLLLRCWDPTDGGHYVRDWAVHNDTRQVRRRVTYILTGAQFGIEPGYVVLGLEPA